jgi:tetratricopeptide (TPR) repeat protein
MRKLIILIGALVLLPMALQAAKVKALFVDSSSKKPVPNVDCKLVNNKTPGQEPIMKSNKKGEADFEKVAAGEYVVKASMKGYFEASSDPITVTDTEKQVSVTVQLVEEKAFKSKEEEANQSLANSKFKEAATIYKEMIKMAPQEAVIWANLAKAEAGMLDQQAALDAAKKAAELDPKEYGGLQAQMQAWVSFEAGLHALESKDFAKAVKLLTESLKVQPQNPDGYYNLALAYGHQRKYDEALKSIDEALKQKPNEKAYLDVKRILEHNAKADK